MSVVIDTNVWVTRLLIADSVSARALDKALSVTEVVVAEAAIEELADVLSRDKWDRYVSLADRQEFLRRVVQVTSKVAVLSEITDCDDPRDNQFLTLAVDAEADCIVSGDRDLLGLDPWRGIRIMSPAEFLAMEN